MDLLKIQARETAEIKGMFSEQTDLISEQKDLISEQTDLMHELA